MFRVGQKVVCVDASFGSFGGENPLRVGVIYTVAELSTCRCYWSKEFGCTLIEVVTSKGYAKFFRMSRFRPAVERKTDISIFTKMLPPARKKELALTAGKGTSP